MNREGEISEEVANQRADEIKAASGPENGATYLLPAGTEYYNNGWKTFDADVNAEVIGKNYDSSQVRLEKPVDNAIVVWVKNSDFDGKEKL